MLNDSLRTAQHLYNPLKVFFRSKTGRNSLKTNPLNHLNFLNHFQLTISLPIL